MHFLVLALLFLFDEEPPERDHRGSEAFPRYYERVDPGPPMRDLVDHDGDGVFIKVVSLNDQSEDTLKVYVQGVVKGKVSPNFQKADKADLAVWCFPSTYSHPNHVFPKARGQIYIHENGDRLVIMTRRFAEDFGLELLRI